MSCPVNFVCIPDENTQVIFQDIPSDVDANDSDDEPPAPEPVTSQPTAVVAVGEQGPDADAKEP